MPLCVNINHTCLLYVCFSGYTAVWLDKAQQRRLGGWSLECYLVFGRAVGSAHASCVLCGIADNGFGAVSDGAISGLMVSLARSPAVRCGERE